MTAVCFVVEGEKKASKLTSSIILPANDFIYSDVNFQLDEGLTAFLMTNESRHYSKIENIENLLTKWTDV